MQVLGQDVEVGDVIKFDALTRVTQPYWAEVTRFSGMRAYNKFGMFRVLTVDVHVTLMDHAHFAKIRATL